MLNGNWGKKNMNIWTYLWISVIIFSRIMSVDVIQAESFHWFRCLQAPFSFGWYFKFYIGILSKFFFFPIKFLVCCIVLYFCFYYSQFGQVCVARWKQSYTPPSQRKLVQWWGQTFRNCNWNFVLMGTLYVGCEVVEFYIYSSVTQRKCFTVSNWSVNVTLEILVRDE
jgi:hypothetical protein